MLSFELSAIDLILAIAVIILFILYITKSSLKPPTIEKPFVKKTIPPREPTTRDASSEKEIERPKSTKPQTNSPKCSYSFGYLGKLDKDASIPEECLSCSRIMICSSANE